MAPSFTKVYSCIIITKTFIPKAIFFKKQLIVALIIMSHISLLREYEFLIALLRFYEEDTEIKLLIYWFLFELYDITDKKLTYLTFCKAVLLLIV